jgi:hypothetical protein
MFSFTFLSVERRREDRIRELCEKLITCKSDGPEFQEIALELRASLAEHIERMRAKLTDYPVDNERRSRPASASR